MFSPRAKRDRQKERIVSVFVERRWRRLLSNLSFAVLLITCCLVIKSTHASLLLPHHCPPAVCSSHVHLTSTLCQIYPSVFCWCYSEAPWWKKRPPVISKIFDNTSLRLREAAWQLEQNSSVWVTDRDKPFVLITGIDYFKYAQLSQPTAAWLLSNVSLARS